MAEMLKADAEAHKATMQLKKIVDALPKTRIPKSTFSTKPFKPLPAQSSSLNIGMKTSGSVGLLSKQALEALKTAKIDVNTVRLTKKLDRKLYEEVNKALEALGGKWDRRQGGHIFAGSPAAKIKTVLSTGEVTLPDKNGYFPTPKPVVKKLLALANLRPGMTVLEPSAGQGAIAEELRASGAKVTTCENLPENVKVLKEKGFKVAGSDFLAFKDGKFDRVVMNPPFEDQTDIDHVLHAYGMLKPGGKLVSVMAAGATFRANKKTLAFRKLVADSKGKILPLPEGSFKESGTNVNSVVVVLPKV